MVGWTKGRKNGMVGLEKVGGQIENGLGKTGLKF